MKKTSILLMSKKLGFYPPPFSLQEEAGYYFTTAKNLKILNNILGMVILILEFSSGGYKNS